ncbi:hypothetical protein Fot_31991 [Forsythia ovata]|uniref:Uncharacterized protein n=1 Tax=Forsythia ovata TaxID=205694 RepID=A0ABD1T6L0_9LAMI
MKAHIEHLEVVEKLQLFDALINLARCPRFRRHFDFFFQLQTIFSIMLVAPLIGSIIGFCLSCQEVLASFEVIRVFSFSLSLLTHSLLKNFKSVNALLVFHMSTEISVDTVVV